MIPLVHHTFVHSPDIDKSSRPIWHCPLPNVYTLRTGLPSCHPVRSDSSTLREHGNIDWTGELDILYTAISAPVSTCASRPESLRKLVDDHGILFFDDLDISDSRLPGQPR